jgi:hypothetical protein
MTDLEIEVDALREKFALYIEQTKKLELVVEEYAKVVETRGEIIRGFKALARKSVAHAHMGDHQAIIDMYSEVTLVE